MQQQLLVPQLFQMRLQIHCVQKKTRLNYLGSKLQTSTDDNVVKSGMFLILEII